METRTLKDGRARVHRRPAARSAMYQAAIRSRVDVLENSLANENPLLGREAEREVLDLLEREDMPGVAVRFRACRDDQDRMRFICKVEYAGDSDTLPWRWWSPLLATPFDLRDSLEEGLALRRLRASDAFQRLPPQKSAARARRFR